MRGPSIANACQTLPKISIVTPSYNQGKFIEETIQSVIEQQYPNFEHIVVDAGSTDHTVKILEKYPHLNWISEPDKGQAHAINKGILMTTGEIVAYLNSDDIYRPGAFHTLAQVFTKELSTQVVVGNCDYIDDKSQKIGFLKARYEKYEDLIRYWGWEKSFCIPQQSVFIRRSVFSEIGLFDTHYHMTMDYDMWLRMAYVYPFRVIDQTLAAFRLAENTKTTSRTHEMYLEEIRASKAHWGKLSLSNRIAVAFSTHRHVGNKMLAVAEHHAFTFAKILPPIKLLMIGISKWPPIILNPRSFLTTVQAIFRKSPLWPAARSIHRAYLGIIWHLLKRVKKPK